MTEQLLRSLLKKARKGDMEAFRELVEETRDRLFGALSAMTGREAIAEEILQESYIALWENRGGADIEKPGAWLYRFCVNRSIDHIRQKDTKFVDEIEEVPEAALTSPDDPEFSLSNKEDAERLKEGLSSLPSRERSIFVLSAYLGYDSFEIASIVGTSPSTVRSQYAGAKRKLALFMKKEKG